MIRVIDHREIVQMLADAAEANDLTLERFYELGRRDELDNPTLRDLWLIWGDELTSQDVEELAKAS